MKLQKRNYTSAVSKDAQGLTDGVVIPVANLISPSVILGSGGKFTRQDPPVKNSCVSKASNLYSPPVAVVEGKKSSLFFWADDFFGDQNIHLFHDKAKDGLYLTTGTVHNNIPRSGDDYVRTSVEWRIGVVADWLEAAKCYRKSYEEKTGARPLWNNVCSWVRNIHVLHTGSPGGPHGAPSAKEAQEYYSDLAKIVDPSKLLLYYWNGSGIVLFSDHRYMTKLGWPKDEVVSALKKNGFHWIAYHPYGLIASPKRRDTFLQTIVKNNWGLPEGYKWTPDYGGEPEKFYDYIRPYAAGYYQKKGQAMDEVKSSWMVHPGSKIGREYMVRNFANYCAFHNADGCYMDTMGADSEFMFPAEKKVLDGLGWRQGEAAFLRESQQKNPELALMSECQSQWTSAYTFLTHEGSSHFNTSRNTVSKLNHPFRTALLGSYTWTEGQEITPSECALVGAIPILILGDEWSIAKAKLFAEEELFNDLPQDKWDPQALAYYRGKGGRWFQYRKLPYGEGFVELAGDTFKPRLVQLSDVTASPITEASYIQDWPAYKDGKPIGLCPDQIYPLIPGTAKKAENFTVTALPPGVFVKNFHHEKNWSVMELGTIKNQPVSGKISLVFSEPCQKIYNGMEEINGPFEPGKEISFTAELPGGFVCIRQEPSAKSEFTSSDFTKATGRNLASGIPDELWAFNSRIFSTTATLNGKQEEVLSLSHGRYRGYAEAWVTVPKDAKPALKFDIGYTFIAKNERLKNVKLRPVICSVQVNGKTIWQEKIDAAKEWQPKEISLDKYSGKKILLTLSVHRDAAVNLKSTPREAPLWLGNLKIENK